jgi:hypothetical protein
MARVSRTKAGTVLTPKIEETLADEAEAGYDLDSARTKRIGRPSLGHGTSPRLDLRVDPDLAKALHQRAKKEHRSISAVARDALRHYLAS